MVNYKLEYFGNTEKGHRKYNQDNFINFFNKYGYFISIMADGMGGHEGGEVASVIAINSIKEELDNFDFGLYQEKKIKEIFLFSVKKALDDMKKYASEDRKYLDMGTTLNLNVFTKEYVFVLNIGDSRTSSITKKAINPITIDQNLATITKKYNNNVDYSSNNYNILTSSLGPRKDLRIELFKAKLNNNGYIMVTTDGVHNFINNTELLGIINNSQTNSLEKKVNKIINAALKNGSTDNLSCSLIYYSNKK